MKRCGEEQETPAQGASKTRAWKSTGLWLDGNEGMEKKMETTIVGYMGDSQNWGYLFGGPNNKDYSILGSILGYPSFGKLPYRDY